MNFFREKVENYDESLTDCMKQAHVNARVRERESNDDKRIV